MNLMLLPTLPQQSGCVLSSRSQELHLSGGCRGKMGEAVLPATSRPCSVRVRKGADVS